MEELIRMGVLPKDFKMHIGGDQLTRERLWWALLLRLGNWDPKLKFANLGAVTYEHFHAGEFNEMCMRLRKHSFLYY